MSEMTQVPTSLWQRIEAGLMETFGKKPEPETMPESTPPQAAQVDNAKLVVIAAENERLAAEVEKLKAEQALNKRFARYSAELHDTVFAGDTELTDLLASVSDEQAAVLVTRFKAVAAQEKLAAVTKPVGAAGDPDGRQETLHDAVVAYSSKHKVDYPTALEAVKVARPDLAQAQVNQWRKGGK